MSRDTSFFQTIKERVSLDDFLRDHLNVELVPNGPGRQAAVCPFHEEDTPSFVLYEPDGTDPWQHWYCYCASSEGGSVIDAVLKSDPAITDAAEAAEYLNELYDLGLEANSEAYQRFKRTVEETRASKEKAREEMADPQSRHAKQARAYLHNRGYTDETIEHFELGVDTSVAKNGGRLSIPLMDKAGHPISVANRALFDKFACRACGETVEAKEMVKRRHQNDKAQKKGEQPPHEDWRACPHCEAPAGDAKVYWLVEQHPKYLFLRDFDKANLLYHEYGARGPLFKDEAARGLYLAEGYPDVWAAWQAGHTSACAYSGSAVSDEQARKAVELALKADKPIILIPDFDDTGQGRFNAGSGVDANIRKLRSVDPKVEVQVIHGLDKLDPPCKDLGEVLQTHGADVVDTVLKANRWNAGEWQIRQIIEAKNPKTGEQFYSKTKEMELIAEILSNIQTRESLDHLIEVLSDHWRIRDEQARNFFYANISSAESTSAQHLFKDIETAQQESAAFLADSNVIALGFEELDACFPGGGVRPGQLMMMLGKAQPMDAKVLTPSGWKLMGDMKVGDEVIDPATGESTQVVQVAPQGLRDIYRVTFSDGSSTRCDLAHLWQVRRADKTDFQVVELSTLVGDDLQLNGEWHLPLTWRDDHDAPTKHMTRVERAGREEAQCIALASESQLYITDDGIVTHNSGTGKAQPLDAKVLTPTGWKLMGDIQVGDEVIDPEGGVARVQGVFPQGERDIYRVTFSDGSSTECDGEHLWKVKDSNHKWQVRTLNRLRTAVQLDKSPHRIPLVAPVTFADAAFPSGVDPYLLGVLIGDATFRNSNVILSSVDEDIISAVAQRLPEGVAPRKVAGDNCEWGLTCGRTGGRPNPLTVSLRELGLVGHRSETKFIPKSFLRGSAESRLELLRGLMDTDGTVSRQSKNPESSCCVEFCTTSHQLALDVQELVRSLGGTAVVKASPSGYRRGESRVECLTRYRLVVSMPAHLNPFRMARKADLFQRTVAPGRRMRSIDFVGRKPAQCISLDSENQLYVTDDYIVTHNTMLASQMLANMADRDVNCLFFSLEQGAGSFYPRLATQALDRPGSEVEELIKEDAEELEKVRELYKNMLIIDNVPTETQEALAMTPGRVQSIIQEANLTHFEGKPVDVVIIDHLGILEVSEDAPADIRKSETAAPGHIMKELFMVCKATRVFMIVLQQLPKQVPPGEPFSYDAGWGGSAQTNFCDYIIQIWRPEQAANLDETEKLEVEGQYKIALGKNRFGASVLGHYFFDKATLRILPPLKITQPSIENAEGDMEDIMFIAPTDADGLPIGPADAPATSGSEIGATAAGLQAMVDASPDNVPRDTQALLDALGAVAAEEDTSSSGDELFGSAGLDDEFNIS